MNFPTTNHIFERQKLQGINFHKGRFNISLSDIKYLFVRVAITQYRKKVLTIITRIVIILMSWMTVINTVTKGDVIV